MKRSYWRIRDLSDYICIVMVKFPSNQVFEISLLGLFDRYGGKRTFLDINQFSWYRELAKLVGEMSFHGKTIKNETQFMLALDVVFHGQRPKRFQKLRKYEEWDMEALKQ